MKYRILYSIENISKIQKASVRRFSVISSARGSINCFRWGGVVVVGVVKFYKFKFNDNDFLHILHNKRRHYVGQGYDFTFSDFTV